MRRLSLKSTDFDVDPKSTYSTTFGVDPKNQPIPQPLVLTKKTSQVAYLQGFKVRAESRT